jgi:hypothetical protein
MRGSSCSATQLVVALQPDGKEDASQLGQAAALCSTCDPTGTLQLQPMQADRQHALCFGKGLLVAHTAATAAALTQSQSGRRS